MKGKIYLIPNSLGQPDPDMFLPAKVQELLLLLKFLIVENTRNARRYLKSIHRDINIDDIRFFELNKHTDSQEIQSFIRPLIQGNDMGLLSEAGVPAVADPGAKVVRLAHEKGIRVVPLTGPSSILMALMASGLNGQGFRFHGYLPVRGKERMQAIRLLEQSALKQGETQIFIETPYRNMQILEDIFAVCNGTTLLTIAVDLSCENESVLTRPVSVWKKKKPELHKRPAVFLIGN